MKVVIAPDSFKGSCSAVRVARAMADGVLRAIPKAEVDLIPIADGGEGTVEALVMATGGQIQKAMVTDPLGRPVQVNFGLLGKVQTGVVEVAAASGLPLLSSDERNPWLTTSRGTGELIGALLDLGCRRIILGLGGSATNDGGMGMAQALGARFVDIEGHEVGSGGGQLERVSLVDLANLDHRILETEFIIACDVTNPLTGVHGASATYGPQKGADPSMVALLDQGLSHFADCVARAVGVDNRDAHGAGAAGGIGFAALSFLKGKLRPGVELVLEAVDFDRRIAGADLVFSGEGCTDAQTCAGKAPIGVARAAAAQGVPVVCLSGGLRGDLDTLYQSGITALFSITDQPMTIVEAMDNVEELLTRAAENIMRVFAAGLHT